MIGALARRVFGTANDRVLKGLRKRVQAINALEPEMEQLSDEALAARTPWFRERLDKGETLDDLLHEAFATVREAARRTLGERHFDVQLIGGMVLHQGSIAEMATGEGKTLASTLALYLNALPGLGAHVVTVNDYLAARDTEWMGNIYRFLGLSVGCITNDMDDDARQAAYACDITYGTNNEFGFDYLRDNMKFSLEEMVQREFNFAIVDEVDSILIDEARTPLIISGPADETSDLYTAVDRVIPYLGEGDYEKDEKLRNVTLTEQGVEKVEGLMRDWGLMPEGNLFDVQNISLLHHTNQALRAHTLFHRDKDYIVKENRVVLVDEFTGRMMEGRRLSEGLHQAIEAKEGCSIQNENQTLASITFQNYFRMYPKLAGMTGTAMTEAGEFHEIYKLGVTQIPTHEPCIRDDQDDEVYRTVREKDNAIAQAIADAHQRNQPVLVGTASVEKSEHVSDLLKRQGIPHEVLNARHHDREAQIIAQAGRPGAVTIATNMAGRGTDIQLGGNPDMRISRELADVTDPEEHRRRAQEIHNETVELKKTVVQAGGLFVLGTERHESRRIDNQLRGRSGRQGDPGMSRFYLSLEDDLMRIFGSDRIDSMLEKLGLEEGEAIKHPWVNKALEKAQQKVEARNFEMRRNLLRFDDVMNDQRKVIYDQRKDLMRADDVSETVTDMRHETVDAIVARCIPPKAYPEQWSVDALHEEVLRTLGMDLPVHDWAAEEGIADEQIIERLKEAIDRKMAEKAANYGPETWRLVEKSLLLQLLDQSWKDHLLNLDHLRQGVGLRAYAQQDPLREYQREAFNLFNTMLENLRERVTQMLSHVELRLGEDEEPEFDFRPRSRPFGQRAVHEAPPAAIGDGVGETDADHPGAGMAPRAGRRAAASVDPQDPETWGRVSRNAACPCGSGRKYKHCHGRAA